MTRRQMLGIRDRVERTARADAPAPVERRTIADRSTPVPTS